MDVFNESERNTNSDNQNVIGPAGQWWQRQIQRWRRNNAQNHEDDAYIASTCNQDDEEEAAITQPMVKHTTRLTRAVTTSTQPDRTCEAIAVLITCAVMMTLIIALVLSRSSVASTNQKLHASTQQLVELAHHNNEKELERLREAMTTQKWADMDACTIVTYVHRRPHYFLQLLSSLRRVDGIDRCLLVISHDYADAVMLSMAREQANFTRHTIQLMHPPLAYDVKGHIGIASHAPREPAGIVRLKYHWWWIVSFVFDTITPIMRSHQSPDTSRNDSRTGSESTPTGSTHGTTGTDRNAAAACGWILFLEEDHVVSRDILTTMNGLITQLPAACPFCWGVSLNSRHSPRSFISAEHPSASAHTTALRRALSGIEGNVGLDSNGYVLDERFWRLLQRQEAKETFWGCRDGWDMSINYLQMLGYLPIAYLSPVVSRLRTIGVHGLNVDSFRFHSLQLAGVKNADELVDDMRMLNVDWKNEAQITQRDGFAWCLAEEERLSKVELDQSLSTDAVAHMPTPLMGGPAPATNDNDNASIVGMSLPPHSRQRRSQHPLVRFPGQC